MTPPAARCRLRAAAVLAAVLLGLAATATAAAAAGPGPGLPPAAGSSPVGTAPTAPGAAPGPSTGPATGAATAPAPSPGPAPTPNPPAPHPKPRPAAPPNGGLPQPATPADPNAPGLFDIPGQIKAAITSLLAALLQQTAVPVVNLLAHLLLSTPDITALARVRQLWDGLRVLTCALYALLILADGILAMAHGTIQHRWHARDLIPRLILGMAAANLSLTICHLSIGLTNAIAAAVFGDGISADDLAGTIVGLLTNVNPDAPLYVVVFGLAVVVMGLALVVGLMVRLAATLFLVVASPLMLACHGAPGLDGVARLWWRAFAGVQAVQITQAVIFLTAVKVVLDPANYNPLGVPTATSLINLVVLAGCLSLMLKTPGWIRALAMAPVTRAMGGRRSRGMRLLHKIALGAVGLPMGPYAFGAQLAARTGLPRARLLAGRPSPGGGAGKPPAGGKGPAGPGGGGPRPGGGAPGGVRPGSGRPGPSAGGAPGGGGAAGGPGAGPPPPPGAGGAPHYAWGQPRANPRSGAGPGVPGSSGTPPPGPAAAPASGPGGAPRYEWGRPRARGPADHLPGQGSRTLPASRPPGPAGPGGLGGPPPAPLPVPPGPPRPALPPARPAPLRPPLERTEPRVPRGRK